MAEAERAGDIRSDVDPATAARLLFGLVNSIVEWYRPGRSGRTQSLADAVCTMALDGLRVRRASLSVTVTVWCQGVVSGLVSGVG